MAKSRRPSPLKSAVTITPGWLTMTGDVAVENVPSPFPNRIVTVLSLRFTTARSSSPSLLKSPRTSVKGPRSEEHTSELQSQSNLVCRLLLEKKKNITLSTARYLHRPIINLEFVTEHSLSYQ